MNINDLKFLPQRLNNTSQNQQQRYYLTNSTTDTFEKTTSAVSFKGRETKVAQTLTKTLQESAKDILANSEILAKFGAFTAAAFAGLAALASGKSDETTQVAETLVAAFNKSEENNEEPTREIINDINDDNIRVVTPEYKEIEETPQEEILDTTDESTSLVQATFPKKHGKYSKEQLALKEMVEGYQLKEDSANKLYEICEEILKSKEASLEKYGFNSAVLLTELPTHSETLEDCEAFIDKLYEQYKNPQTETKTEPINEPNASAEESSLEVEEIYVPEGEKEVLTGSKVLGKIDVTGYKSYIQKVEEKKALAEAKAKEVAEKEQNPTTAVADTSTDNKTVKVKRARIVKTNPKEDFRKTSLDSVDKNNEILHFKIPGTLEPNVKNNLTRLLLRFEDYVSKDNTIWTKWMHRTPISDAVLVDDIKQEIRFRQGGDCPYRNISVEDAEELADLINGDYRFKDLFTLHSALRLIDRFVNFDSDVPLEEQCSYAITKLYNALQKAMSNGVDIEVYEDFKHEAFAARMVIEPDKKANPDAFDIAGSYPLKITICENQDDPSNYQFSRKLPIISTIFSKGL